MAGRNTVYDLLARKIDKLENDAVEITAEPGSGLDKVLTWAEGFGYRKYKEGE